MGGKEFGNSTIGQLENLKISLYTMADISNTGIEIRNPMFDVRNVTHEHKNKQVPER